MKSSILLHFIRAVTVCQNIRFRSFGYTKGQKENKTLILFVVEFQKYLVPQAQEHTGITKEGVVITNDAMQELIKSYCRESGVRNLQKQVEKVISCQAPR